MMKSFYFVIIVVFLSDISKKVLCQDPISITLLVSSLVSAYYLTYNDNVIKDKVKRVVKKIGQKIGYYEGCENYWIPENMEALRRDLEDTVYGQSIGNEMVLKALTSHLANSRRSLTLSFHGDPGTGKSFVSKKILKHMFRQGKNTEYVHFFRGSIDFPLQHEVHKYKEQIAKIIQNKIYECHRSVFVFDEVDKMPSGVIDVLSGFINQGRSGDYDYRRAIFIFLSNVGGRVLLQETLQNFIMGQDRMSMNKHHLSQLLAEEAYDAKGGLKNSDLIRSLSTSHYIPFLPLEKAHVVQCLKKEVEKLNQLMSDELEAQVLQELRFIPDDNPIFIDGGCKIVPEKVQFFITRQQRRNRMKSYL